MSINHVSISNFKSFASADIDLNKFNVLIGANASGKSNFVQFFRFLRDLSNFGLENAISMQGGIDYFLNNKIGVSKEFRFQITSKRFQKNPPLLITSEKQLGFELYEYVYTLSVKFGKIKSRWEITEDSLVMKCRFKNYIHSPDKTEECDDLGLGEIQFSREGKGIALKVKYPKGIEVKEDDVFVIKASRDFLSRIVLDKSDVLAQISSLAYFEGVSKSDFNSISVYDFDPKLCKKAQPITGKADLEEDASNLTIVINNLLRKGQRRKFYSILNDLLPFIDRINTRTFANNLIFQLTEKYNRSKSLPSFLVSDGTVSLTALVVALFFERKRLKIIEEPERNIHPYLASKVVDIMRDASQMGQIVTTSHNPEIVRYSAPEELFLVRRTSEGYSEITRPAEKREIKVFLGKELGLSELYVQNLLEAYSN